jgi:hypothetical protein
MLISTAKHKRIVAQKDAEIAGLMKRIGLQAEHNNALRTRLAPFTKIRNRDAKGRFIKDIVA